MLLGEFKAAVRAADPNREPDTFTLEGDTFTVSDRDLTMVMADFAHAASSGLDDAEMEGLAAMRDMLLGVVVEEDQGRLRDLSKRVGLDAETLMDIVKAVVERETGKATVQPSDSSAGPSSIGASSRVSSLSVASSAPGEEWRNSPLGRRELAANPEAYANVKPIDQAALASLTG